ncbi:MAG TPA: FAD-dependent oxidoreductase [Gammaproteobacteria bacterium]|nr:FAD-dependent oxidoreductase [Gammaproteobacteria bacterium]
MDFEVVVIGAGVVGSSLALSLAKEGVDVCLIDKGTPEIKEDISRGRTAALNLASQNILEKLGVKRGIQNYLTPFKNIYVWDSEGTSSLEFSSDEIGQPKLGDVVTNNAILSSIFLLLPNHKNLRFLSRDRLKTLDPQEESIKVCTEGGENISCKLVVGADGGLSSVRELSSINIRTWSYDQKALIANLKAEKSHSNTAYQVFTKNGPIALLPMQKDDEESLSLVWSADIDYAERLLDLDIPSFLNELERKTESILGKLSLDGEMSSYPLHQLHAKDYYAQRVVLIGDAAHSMHPLAGQGLNLGLGDVEELASRILRSRRHGEDVGNDKMLSDYSKARKSINLRMMGFMEVFKQGFGSTNPWVRLGRNMAFGATQKAPELRKRFIKEAAGII